MSNYQHYLLLCTMIAALYYGSGCEDDMPVPLAPCEWQLSQTPLVTDTCFDRTTTSLGQYVIPPTFGKEVYKIAFDPTEEEIIFFTTWERMGIGGAPDSRFYRLDLCNDEVTYVGLFENYTSKRLFLNSQGKLLISTAVSQFKMYDLNTLEEIREINTHLEYASNDYVWASDTTFYVSSFIELPNGDFLPSWLLCDIEGNTLDTLSYSSGTASAPRDGRTVFHTVSRSSLAANLYVYDNQLGIAVDSMMTPADAGYPFHLQRPQWLNSEEVVLMMGRMIVVGNFADQDFRVVKELPQNCDNTMIESVAVVPNRPDEILYTLQYYFYNEAGEYRKRHDIVHLNIATGEERVLVVE